MLFVHNTSRVDDEPYPTLLQDKGFRGFPSLCFMDADGNVLTKPGRSVAAFVETHQKTKRLAELRQKGDKASADEQKELFLVELNLDLVPAPQIQARADKLPLSDAEKALASAKIVDAEVNELLQQSRSTGLEQTAEKLAAMAKAGKKPSDTTGGQFWNAVLQHASKHKDAALAKQAFDALQQRFANDKNPQIERAKQQWQKLLDEAQAK